jgi:serine/threonine-protein kinase
MDVPHIVAGRFRIECEIGKGGMGTVYRATHLGLERPVAVKIIKPEYAFDADVADRFMREARTMARLRHPQAAMIFDAGNLPDGRHFIVMEFVEGETLCDALARERTFSPQRAVRIASEICNVLSEAHALGIVHRDLKPSNIMLSNRGICVLDFGVAKVLATSADATATHATTGSGVIVGTPRYMSPEQCLGQRIEARSDLYSLGVLLYEMLTGNPPFTDPLPSAVLVKQATAPPISLATVRPDIPRPLAQAIHLLLAKRPEQRPVSAAAARVLLEKSLVKPSHPVEEIQPFAGTVASLTTPGRGPYFRAATPVAILVVLGGTLLMWGSAGQMISRSGAPVEAATLSSRDAAATGAKVVSRQIQPVQPEVLEPSPVTRGKPEPESKSSLRIIRAPNGEQLMALHEGNTLNRRSLSILEKHGSGFRVVNRAPLDMPDFTGAKWSADELDLDGDGYDEVMYKGTGAEGKEGALRMVLYAPRRRQFYALRVQPDKPDGPKRLTLSPNLRGPSTKFLRAIMVERARASKM